MITLSEQTETTNPQAEGESQQQQQQQQQQPQQQTTTQQPAASFDSDGFFTRLDERLSAFGEQVTSGVNEVFSSARQQQTEQQQQQSNTEQQQQTQQQRAEEKTTKDDTAQPGKRTFAQRWFG